MITDLQRQFEQFMSSGDQADDSDSARIRTPVTTARHDRGSGLVSTIDQYHLSRLQLINWACSMAIIRFVHANGALITGSSGSGKSSLLDAISLAFLPDHRRNFNASGDATAAGSSSGKRTVGKHVRGAWERRSGTSAGREIMYLRGTDRRGRRSLSPTHPPPARPSPAWSSNGLPPAS